MDSAAMRRYVVRVLLLFAILFAIGFVTRLPAIRLSQFYGLHGVLSAPFFAAVAAWHFQRDGSMAQLGIAFLLLAAVLGAMSPVMGVGFVLMAAVASLAYYALGKAKNRDFVAAAVLGAASYPCTVAAGLAMHSYFASVASLPIIVVMVVLGAALGVLGSACMQRTR